MPQYPDSRIVMGCLTKHWQSGLRGFVALGQLAVAHHWMQN